MCDELNDEIDPWYEPFQPPHQRWLLLLFILLQGYLQRHTNKQRATDQAAVFDPLGVRMSC